MAFTDFFKALRTPAQTNEYVASRPAAGSLSATGALALNDDDGLAAKVINTKPYVPEAEEPPEQVEPDEQPTDVEEQSEDTEDEQPKSVRDLLLDAFAGEPDLPTNVTQEDVEWARRVVVSGDRTLDLPAPNRMVKRDARSNAGSPFTPAQPAPTEGQRAALEHLHNTGERGTVAIPDGLDELLEAATSSDDEVVDLVMDAINLGGASNTFFDR